MKTLRLLTIAATVALASATASAQDVTYVEDCTQGVLVNRTANNWFLTLQGGANMYFSRQDIHADIKNRIAPQAALYVGKWTNPNFGFRFGANAIMTKGACESNGFFRDMKYGSIPGKPAWYSEKFLALGPEFDVLVNLTNWWCGYRPDRVYTAVAHGGAGAYWTWRHRPSAASSDIVWHAAHETFLFVTAGLQNNFRVAKNVQLFLDAQFQLLDYEATNQGVSYVASLNAGVTIDFGKNTWSCPVVAQCPTWKYTDAEGDALAARLAQANNKIKDLQAQLDACMSRPVDNKTVRNTNNRTTNSSAVANDCEGLVTIYYPINVYTLSKSDKTVLNSVAEVMKSNTNTTYQLTGWADNYTGNDKINTRLRTNRVNGVKDYLVGRGVNAAQLDATIDNGNLTDLGAKAAPLDRAVTIREAK